MASLSDELKALSTLPRANLVELWEKTYRCPPPKGVKQPLLERAAAYHLQANTFGGLKPALRKSLRAMMQSEPEASGRPKTAPPVKAGTRLVREWQGVAHTVHVLEGSVLYKEKHYNSLSAVALAITGAKWSGPRFFGL